MGCGFCEWDPVWFWWVWVTWPSLCLASEWMSTYTLQAASGRVCSNYPIFSPCLQTWLLINPSAVTSWNWVWGLRPACSLGFWESCKQGIIWNDWSSLGLGRQPFRRRCARSRHLFRRGERKKRVPGLKPLWDTHIWCLGCCGIPSNSWMKFMFPCFLEQSWNGLSLGISMTGPRSLVLSSNTEILITTTTTTKSLRIDFL